MSPTNDSNRRDGSFTQCNIGRQQSAAVIRDQRQHLGLRLESGHSRGQRFLPDMR
jgi:hypothetical protein